MIALDAGWNGFGGLHGGLAVAWLLEQVVVPDAWRPVSVSTHFLGAVRAEEDTRFEVETLHAGRTTASSAVRLLQAERVRAHAVVATAVDREPDGHDGPWSPVADLTGLPSPHDLALFRPPAEVVPFGQHVDIRPTDGVLPGSGAPEPAYDAWIRLADEQHVRELGAWGSAAVLLDAMPPGLFALTTRVAMVPTTDLTVHFAPRTTSPDGWFHVRHATRWASASACVDETELRTSGGRLVAQARQARRII